MQDILSFSIKNIFYDKMDLRLFYFHVTTCLCSKIGDYDLHAEVTIHNVFKDHLFTLICCFKSLTLR